MSAVEGMPIPFEILTKLQAAAAYLKAGKTPEATAETARAGQMLDQIWSQLSPTEALFSSALIAMFPRRCGNIESAMLRLEKVCTLAQELDPDSPQTVGDFIELAECHEAVGKLSEALAT